MNPRYSFRYYAKQLQDFGLKIDASSDWSQLERLRAAFDDLSEYGYSPTTPAASVYQTALQIRMRQLEEEQDREGQQRWFFRGQRCYQWLPTPLTFRDLPNTAELQNEYLARISRVRGIVHGLQELALCRTEFEGLAIAQHYSKELNIRPWLLDVTRSPYVSLFFASDGGQDGDIGVISYIERTEWLLFSEGSPETAGRIRYTSSEGIPRIVNQEAFFIEAPHPELYRQMSHRSYYFRQRSGVEFHDTPDGTGFSRDQAYPQDDPVLEKLSSIESKSCSVALAWEPSLSALTPPEASVFKDIVVPWTESFDKSRLELTSGVCRLHAAITRRQDAMPYYIGTLHHLRRVVKSISDEINEANEESILEFFYTLHLCDGNRDREFEDAFAACVAEAGPTWAAAFKARQ